MLTNSCLGIYEGNNESARTRWVATEVRRGDPLWHLLWLSGVRCKAEASAWHRAWISLQGDNHPFTSFPSYAKLVVSDNH